MEIARDQLAGKEMEVGRWYLNEALTYRAIYPFKVVAT